MFEILQDTFSVDQHERESAKLAFCHLLSKIILIPALV